MIAQVEGHAEHFLKQRVLRGDWSSQLKHLKKMTKGQECRGHHDWRICMCPHSWKLHSSWAWHCVMVGAFRGVTCWL